MFSFLLQAMHRPIPSHQQPPPPAAFYRLRPLSVGRPPPSGSSSVAARPQRRSVAAAVDLQRYVNAFQHPPPHFHHHPHFAPPPFASGTLPRQRPPNPRPAVHPNSRQPSSSSRPAAPLAQFPTLSVEKTNTLPRKSRRSAPPMDVEENNSVDKRGPPLFRWLRDRRNGKQTRQSRDRERASWTGSLPRNLPLRFSSAPPAQTATLLQHKTSTGSSAAQPETFRPPPALKRRSLAPEPSDGHYDNASPEGYAATFGRRTLPRYNDDDKEAEKRSRQFNTLPRTVFPPPEPAPDYEESTLRVRFRLDEEMPLPKRRAAQPPPTAVPVVDHRESIPRPRGHWAKTFERTIVSRLRPLIQIRGVKVDEKEMNKQRTFPPSARPESSHPTTERTTARPQPQRRSILTNGESSKVVVPAPQPSVPSKGEPSVAPEAPLLRRPESSLKKRRAPSPPVEKMHVEIPVLVPLAAPAQPPSPLPTLDLDAPATCSAPVDDSTAGYDTIPGPESPPAERGICYVAGTRIEYRLEHIGPDQLLVHFETRDMSAVAEQTADASLFAGLLGDSPPPPADARPRLVFPLRGTLTDLEYGPGIVQRLREKFSRLAQESAPVLVSHRRFPSADDLLDSTANRTNDPASQTLPRMKTSKSALEPLTSSSTTTGYSSEESSGPSDSKSQTSPSLPPKRFDSSALPARFPTTSTEVRTASEKQAPSRPAETNDSTDAEVEAEAARVPIRSLREKFERHPRSEYNVRTMFSPRSASAHTIARYDHPPPNRPAVFPPAVQPERVVLRSTGRELQQRQSQGFTGTSVPLPPFKQRTHSPPSSTGSSDSPQSEEVHQETSDDMESLQSQEEEQQYAVVMKGGRSDPVGLFYQPTSTYEPPELSIGDLAEKKRAGFTLPLNRPVLQHNGRQIPLGRPGHTPTAEGGPAIPPEKTAALKDATGMFEVHRLLDRFNAKRTAEQSTPVAPTHDFLSSVQKTADKPPLPRPPSGLVDPPAHQKAPLTATFSLPPPSAQPTPARRSLSAQYLESKKASGPQRSTTGQTAELLAEQHTISEHHALSVDGAELDHEENTSISSMDSLDVVEEIADYEQDTMFAHENGPVRHSLLNLVCQEDIPELLQAMAEDLHFVFDDYLSTRPPMNGIMMSSAKRRSSSQKRQRDNNRICFASESPKVFTYLDETSALSEEKWMDGRLIAYEEYLNLQATASDQAARQALELNKWRAVMRMKYEREDAINSATSQFSQTSLQPPQTSPSSSRTPTPDEIDRSPTTTPRFLYTALTSQRPTLPSMTRQEVGTSAI